MPKKIVIVNGSPRGGTSNTLMLAKAFVRKQNPDNVEIVDLSKERIEFCTGCFSCWMQTPGKCIHNDDAAKIHAKLMEADYLIWSLPLYAYSIPAKTKALIERSLPYSLPFINEKGSHPVRGGRKAEQKAVLISTAGFYKKANNFEGIITQFDALYKENTKILCPQGELFSKPPFRGLVEAYLNDLAAAGEEYFNSGEISAASREKIDRLLYPIDKFVKLANANWGVDDEGNLRGFSPPMFQLSQMAALYNSGLLAGRKVIEFCFPDFDCRCRMVMEDDCRIIADGIGEFDTRIETDFSVWLQVCEGLLNPTEAAQSGRMRIEGDISLLAMMDKVFAA